LEPGIRAWSRKGRIEPSFKGIALSSVQAGHFASNEGKKQEKRKKKKMGGVNWGGRHLVK